VHARQGHSSDESGQRQALERVQLSGLQVQGVSFGEKLKPDQGRREYLQNSYVEVVADWNFQNRLIGFRNRCRSVSA
jgi:hypothetical protein